MYVPLVAAPAVLRISFFLFSSSDGLEIPLSGCVFVRCGEVVLQGALRHRSRLKSSVCWSRGGMKGKSEGLLDECSLLEFIWEIKKARSHLCTCVSERETENVSEGVPFTRVKLLNPLWIEWLGIALLWCVRACKSVCVSSGCRRGNSTRANCFLPAYCQRQSLFLGMGRHVSDDYSPEFRLTLPAYPAQPIALLYNTLLYHAIPCLMKCRCWIFNWPSKRNLII